MSPLLTPEFLRQFKKDSEAKWSKATLNGSIYGFQITPGTRWLPGLGVAEIDAYERQLHVVFPADFKLLLQHLNGTDRETLNVYGSSGHPHQAGPGVYSYPRDLGLVRSLMEEWKRDWREIVDACSLKPEDVCVPLFMHRGVVCRKDRNASPVLSIMGTDSVLYEESLQLYLQKEFLEGPPTLKL